MKVRAQLLVSFLGLHACAPDYLDLGYDHAAVVTTGTTGSGGTGGGQLCTPGEVQECYSGPAETKGQGICKSGISTCNAEGTGFGVCVGEVLPKPAEDCATALDDNCDGVAACGGVFRWALRFGDDQAQDSTAVAADPSGAVWITGNASGSVDFGGGALPSIGFVDIFLAKLGADGTHQWSKRYGDPQAIIGNPSQQSGTGLATDATGNVVLVGSYSGAIDFGGGKLTATGLPDVFVVKLGSDGAHHWSKRYGDAGTQAASSAAIDSEGNVVLAGSFAGAIDFGGGSLVSAGGSDIFVAKLTEAGAHVWSKRFGDSSAQTASSIAVDSEGNVVVAGSFTGSVDFGGGALNSAGSSDAFAVKLGSDGAYLWSKTYGDESTQTVSGIATDSTGNVVLAGTFAGTVDFGGGAVPSTGTSDAFLVTLSPDGSPLWTRHYGDGNKKESASATGVAVDAAGNVVLTGSFSGVVDFGGGPLGGLGGDVFLLKLLPDGGYRWSYRFGDTASQIGQSIAVDSMGNVDVTGRFSGTIDFGGGALASAGASDGCVASFAP